MTTRNPFAIMLSGGHPNSLGRTVEVVEMVLADPSLLEQVFQCYTDSDEVVRLRTSSAMKRVWRAQPEWVVPYIDRFLNEVARIPQASAQWTVADLVSELSGFLTEAQRQTAIARLQTFLTDSTDWIVLINSFTTLHEWSLTDPALRAWLEPHLVRLSQDPRKSVARKASRLLTGK